MAYEQFRQNQLILRDQLAIDRTRLANERTLLAYLRTSFMVMVAGVTAIKLFGDSRLAVLSGWLLLGLGGLVGLLGSWRFAKFCRAIRSLLGEGPPG